MRSKTFLDLPCLSSTGRIAVVAVALGCALGCLGAASPAASAACPNEALRTGASSSLPDCRAYELVTPTAAGQLLTGIEFTGSIDMFDTDTVGVTGSSFLFGTNGATFLNPPGGGGGLGHEVWEAVRAADGWGIARHLPPAPEEAVIKKPGGVDARHEYIFTHVGPAGASLPKGEFGSLFFGRGADYLGGPDGRFSLTGCGSLGCEPYAQGRYISPGGGHVIFSTGATALQSAWCEGVTSKYCKVNQLEPEAAPTGTGAIYDRPATGGPTQVISLLPGDNPPAAGEDAFYQGASADGSSAAFTIAGVLYARVENEKTEQVTSAPATYGGFSADGRYLFYLNAGNIHRFDTEDGSDQEVNSSGDAAMMNVSEDGSHVYFISPSQLDGPEGTAGQPNVYLWAGGATQFVATVLPSDLEGVPALGKWAAAVRSGANSGTGQSGPGVEASRTTPDGGVMIFESAAELAGYQTAGHVEIYRYEEGGSIRCVSCNAFASPAIADARLQSAAVGSRAILNNLSSDGSRVFFETSEALVEADADNGINDSYEWHLVPGIAAEPELGLISSGQSHDYLPGNPEAALNQNPLMGISKDGSNVFFSSTDALVPGAGLGGTVEIYDARIDGGFPQPPVPEPCLGEACRPPLTPPPALGSAASALLQGAGNPRPRKQRHRHRRHRCRRHAKKRKACSRKHAGARAAAAAISADTASAQGITTGASGPAASTQAEPPVALSATGGEFEGYGIESTKAEASTAAAAMHPDLTTTLKLKQSGSYFAAKTEGVTVKLPPGLYANPNLTPRCNTINFLTETCPIDTQVGLSKVRWVDTDGGVGGVDTPVFNLAPPHPDTEIARFGLTPWPAQAVYLDVSVRTAGDYGATVTVPPAPGYYPLISAETAIWGNPADPSHDKVRMTVTEAANCGGTACEAPGGERAPEELGPIAFTTNPSACGPWSVGFEATSYQLPGRVFSAEAPVEPGPVTDCQGLPFAPSLEARPTTDVAGAPTGLKTTLQLPQSTDPTVPSTATMRETRITLPEGMAINPGAADGLAACSAEQVHFHEELDASCPDAAKLGSATISSPALPRPLQGALYQRSPAGKGEQFGLWLVSDDLGLHVHLPGAVKPDPGTGQLTIVFADLPQVPTSAIEVEVWGGARAPLRNPETCGTYETTSAIAPWSSDPAATPSDRFAIDRGPSGGPCPASGSDRPNSPDFEAGTETPVAATYSPLVLKLHREDAGQAFGALEVTLPPGLLGKLAGVGQCPEAALAAAAAKTGAAELAAPSCPPDSRVGGLWVAAGAGPAPYWTPGSAYLAGPYRGAPLSIAFITPAVAGPFDLGTVLVRSALRVDPISGQITAQTDRLPQILEGVPLNLRTVAFTAGRDQFTLNGTSCDPLAFSGSLTSTLGSVAALSERFQLAECARLKFKPRLSLALKGPTKRTANPTLVADLKAKPGAANIAGARVKLPRTAFLDNSHIGTVCTRVQFAADRCPKRSVYGRAWAKTPLLDYKLSGAVYLRSSDHLLPDLVVKLKGPASQPVEFDLLGRIDSVKGALRTTFETAPDAPVRRFHLVLFGGRRGIIELTSGLCRDPRAAIRFTAHNGKVYETSPQVKTGCAKNSSGKRHRGPRHH